MGGSEDAAGRNLAGGADIDQRLREATDVLEAVAKRVARRLGSHADVDELKAFGREALLQIVSGYDPARAPFRAYVAIKLKWAILDGWRRQTHGRAGARLRALMASERVSDWPVEPAPRPPQGDEEDYELRLRTLLETHAAALAVGLVAGPDELASIVDEATSPEDRAARTQSRAALLRAMAELPERERIIIERHYFRGERFDGIAAELGISKSWASRLHTQAILALGRALREPEE